MKATGETPSGVRDQRVRRSPVVQLWRWGILLALLVLMVCMHEQLVRKTRRS